jgi:N4-(beta-N-acetylglucosaminyl)-L-asparaginase
MPNRRSFLKTAALGAIVAPSTLEGCAPEGRSGTGDSQRPGIDPVRPVALSTWEHGLSANGAAWDILSSGGKALDAVEAGVRVPEGDPAVTTVGYGGYPDRYGKVTLDACIMDESGRCGSVAFLQEIKHPVSVARKVMELTPHVMLVGRGALDFALANGFQRENLLTPEAEAAWERWKEENGETRPLVNIESHDTIGMLTLDSSGDLAGACTTGEWETPPSSARASMWTTRWGGPRPPGGGRPSSVLSAPSSWWSSCARATVPPWPARWRWIG